MSDEDDSGTVVHGPWNGDSSYVPPPIPDYADTLPSPEDIPAAPPESPEETTMELPPIPAAPDPSAALRSDGITAPETGEDDGDGEEGEYIQSRSLADRLGDWLEFRLERARANHESEAPFREAEIARKAALLEGRTAQEVAMMEQNGKLHAAMMKAKGDKAAAQSKADADRMKSSGSNSSGLGPDKGRSKAGGGGGSSRGGSSGGGPSRNNGASRNNSVGSAGRSGSQAAGSGGGRGAAKGPDRSPGGRNPGSGRNGPPGGSKGSQNGSGGSKGDGSGRAQPGPASSARAERARGRQDRAGLRQAGRQERRSAGHAAAITDRTKDRDQKRDNRQKDWEDRRARKAQRAQERNAKREAAASSEPDHTTLGQAITEEAQRRFDKRRADAKAATDAKDAKDGDAGTEKVSLTKEAKDTKAEPEKVSLVKEAKDTKPGDAASEDTEPGDGTKDAEEAKEAKAGDVPSEDTGDTGDTGDTEPDAKKAAEEPSDGSEGADPEGGAAAPDSSTKAGSSEDKGDPPGAAETDPDAEGDDEEEPAPWWRFEEARARVRGWWDDPQPAPAEDEDGEDWTGRTGRVRAEDLGYTFERPDRPTREERGRRSGPPPGIAPGPRSLPPAPEPHTQRPGTSRPTSTEGNSVSSTQVSRPSGQGGLPTQHRTDITFSQFLMEMANIAVQAGLDKDRAEDLASALARVAGALRDMAVDLAGDHNVTTEVINLVSDLADAADLMKAQAQRCAAECDIAFEAAKLVAVSVAKVYGQDMDAKKDAGLTYVSAAAHHD